MQQIAFLLVAALVRNTFACTSTTTTANGPNCQAACSTLATTLNAPNMQNPTYNIASVQASCTGNTAATTNTITATCPAGQSLQFFQPTSTTPQVLMTNSATLTCTTTGWQATIPAVGTTAAMTVLSPPFQLACVNVCTNSCPRNAATALVQAPTAPVTGAAPTITAVLENALCMGNNAQSAIGDTYTVVCPTPATQIPVLVTTAGAVVSALPAATITLTCGANGWANGAQVINGATNRITCATCNTASCPATVSAAFILAPGPTIAAPAITSTCMGAAGYIGQTRTITCTGAGLMTEAVDTNGATAGGTTAITSTLTCLAGGWTATASVGGAMSALAAANQLTCIA